MLIGALLLCAAVRFYLLWQYYCISSDGVHYIEAAQAFYAGRWWAGLGSYYSPGYPILLALVYPLTANWELSGQLFSILCGVVLLWPLYLLVQEVFDDERIALVAVYLAALSPFLARYSAHVRSESPYFLLVVVALLLFQRGYRSRRALGFFLGGLVAGFAYLVRPEAIGLLVVMPLFLAIRVFLSREIDLRWATGSSLAMIGGFVVFALPYIVYLSIETGQWGALSRKAGVTLAVSLSESGLLEGGEREAQSPEEASDFLGFVKNHPLLFAKKVLWDFFPAIGTWFEAMHFPFVPFMLIGLTLLWRNQFWQRRDLLLLTYVLFFVFGLAIILVRRRYSVQVVPICLGWSALGLVWLWDWLKANVNESRARIAVGLTVATFLAATLPKTLAPISREKGFVREAGRYLKQRGGAEAVKVAVFDDRVTFYAGAQALLLSGVNESMFPDYLKTKKPDYLAAEAKTWQKTYPKIAAAPAQLGLILEKEFVGVRNDRMLLFKVALQG